MANQCNPHSILNALSRLEGLRDPASAARKRQFRRFVIRGDAELVDISDARMDRPPLRVQLRDVGWGGLGFICTRPLAANSMWRMNFLSHEYQIGTQTILVRHSAPVEQGIYLIGGQFCLDPGMLCLLGVDPSLISAGGMTNDDGSIAFQAPGEVA